MKLGEVVPRLQLKAELFYHSNHSTRRGVRIIKRWGIKDGEMGATALHFSSRGDVDRTAAYLRHDSDDPSFQASCLATAFERRAQNEEWELKNVQFRPRFGSFDRGLQAEIDLDKSRAEVWKRRSEALKPKEVVNFNT